MVCWICGCGTRRYRGPTVYLFWYLLEPWDSLHLWSEKKQGKHIGWHRIVWGLGLKGAYITLYLHSTGQSWSYAPPSYKMVLKCCWHMFLGRGSFHENLVMFHHTWESWILKHELGLILGRRNDIKGHGLYRHQRNQGVFGDSKGVLFDLRIGRLWETVTG